jgi:serine/threonine protein kinase
MNRKLRARVAKFLERHVGGTAGERLAVLHSALNECPVVRQIAGLDNASDVFVSNMITTLWNYGRCEEDHESSLVMLIRYIGNQNGEDVHQMAEALCLDLNQTYNQEHATEPVQLETKLVGKDQFIGGRYQLIEPIGDPSGQATVWKAQDNHDQKVAHVAVKCMKPHPTRDSASRFVDEVRSLRDLDQHEHIMSIYDFGIDGDLYYLVMPLMSESLRALMNREGHLPPKQALGYLLQMADALDFVHTHGIIHRDLKPANMLFTRETRNLWLADFGIAFRTSRENTVTKTGEIVATEEYAAPEQLRENGIVTEKSDIYALAIIAYEMLAGELPFTGSPAEITTKHLQNELPAHPYVAPFVLQVLRTGAAKDPALRPQRATDFVRHLEDALEGKALEVVRHYLDEVILGHLMEVMPDHVYKSLKDGLFVNPQAEIRQQVTTPEAQDDGDDDIHWDWFPPEVRAQAPPQIELSGEFHPPREARYSDNVEYAKNVRERLKGLKRVVVLGEPGAGKTFILGRLALDLSDMCRADPTVPLPVFIPLSRYDSADSLEAFVAARLGVLGGRLSEHKIIWLLDALNEMPRDKSQWGHLKDFIAAQVKADAPFILTCRVKNYEEDLYEVPDLHRVDLQSLNPQQIYHILEQILKPRLANYIWETVMHGAGLKEAWEVWDGSVDDFWKMPEGNQQHWNEHTQALARIHNDPRKLMLLCRSPFTLVQLLVVRIATAFARAESNMERLTAQLEEMLPNNRALLFGAVIDDMLKAEGKREGWTEMDIANIHTALAFAADALQATEQRTEIALTDLLNANNAPSNLSEGLKMGRDAILITMTDTRLRFNHELFQEYFATRKLRDLLEAFSSRNTGWEAGPALPPRDERLVEMFPDWWDVGGSRVTVAMLGEFVSKDGIDRTVRWLAGYAPEIAMIMVQDNNDGLTLADLSDVAKQALIEGAHQRKEETHPEGRAAAYRVLKNFDADNHDGVT